MVFQWKKLSTLHTRLLCIILAALLSLQIFRNKSLKILSIYIKKQILHIHFVALQTDTISASCFYSTFMLSFKPNSVKKPQPAVPRQICLHYLEVLIMLLKNSPEYSDSVVDTRQWFLLLYFSNTKLPLSLHKDFNEKN